MGNWCVGVWLLENRHETRVFDDYETANGFLIFVTDGFYKSELIQSVVLWEM